MSWQEWLTIVEWMTTRWPEFARTEEPVIQAMYEDLKLYAGQDVHNAVIYLHRNGRESPPKGSTILKSLKEHGVNPAHVFGKAEYCEHVWALPTDWEVLNGNDKKVCVLCKRETVWEGAWKIQREARQREEQREVQPDEEGNRDVAESGAESPF